VGGKFEEEARVSGVDVEEDQRDGRATPAEPGGGAKRR
jgi:hypothetical protein